MRLFCLQLILCWEVFMTTNANEHSMEAVEKQQTQTPQYLYKVLSLENWQQSQAQNIVILTKDDEVFIHLATEDQLDRIIDKYWSQAPHYVILKIDPTQLPGQLIYEANPGGTNKYFHLYHGSIPRKAVVNAQTVNAKK